MFDSESLVVPDLTAWLIVVGSVIEGEDFFGAVGRLHASQTLALKFISPIAYFNSKAWISKVLNIFCGYITTSSEELLSVNDKIW